MVLLETDGDTSELNAAKKQVSKSTRCIAMEALQLLKSIVGRHIHLYRERHCSSARLGIHVYRDLPWSLLHSEAVVEGPNKFFEVVLRRGTPNIPPVSSPASTHVHLSSDSDTHLTFALAAAMAV